MAFGSITHPSKVRDEYDGPHHLVGVQEDFKMFDVIDALQGTPVPTILVVGGLLFIFLGLGGKLTAGEIPADRRKYFGATGGVLLLLGIVMFVIPQRITSGENSTGGTASNIPTPPIPAEISQSEYDQAVGTASAFNQVAEILYGPTSGELTGEDDGSLECNNAEVLVRNAIIKIRFTYPHQMETWSFGLNFRHLGRNQQYRLFVNQDGAWEAQWDRVNSDGDRIATTIDGGRLSNLIKGEAAANQIDLFVSKESALFFFNDKYISRIDISHVLSPGDVAVCIDYQADVDALKIDYEAFTIWELP